MTACAGCVFLVCTHITPNVTVRAGCWSGVLGLSEDDYGPGSFGAPALPGGPYKNACYMAHDNMLQWLCY